MRWLITVDATCALDTLAASLAAAGAELDVEQAPVPLGADEIAVAATGPDDLPIRARDIPGIRAVHRDSELTQY